MTKKSTKDRREKPTYDRESLSKLALQVFRERGYDATSMEDLARAAGVTKSSFYYWVSGKEELLQIGIDRALDQLFALLGEPASKEGTPTDRLRHIMTRSVKVEVDHLAAVSVLLRARGNSPVERAAIERRREFTRAIADIVALGVQSGEFNSALDPGLTARLIFGMENSLVEWLREGSTADAETISTHINVLVFDGLLTG